MTETIRYSKIMTEDLALGLNTRQVRLADQSVRTLKEISLTTFLLTQLTTLNASAFTGQPTMTIPAGLVAGRRIWGVTVKNLVELGATGSLTGYLVGDTIVPDRWSNAAFPLTVPFESDEGDFADASLMVYTVSTDIVLSGVGGLFDATGQVEVAVHYSVLRHPG